MYKDTLRLFILNNCNSYLSHNINLEISIVYLKLAVFDCTNPLIEACATTANIIYKYPITVLFCYVILLLLFGSFVQGF